MTQPNKIRVYEISKLLGIPNKDLLTFIEENFTYDIKSHSSSIDASVGDEIVAAYRAKKGGVQSAVPAPAPVVEKSAPVQAPTPVQPPKPSPTPSQVAPAPAAKSADQPPRVVTSPTAPAPVSQRPAPQFQASSQSPPAPVAPARADAAKPQPRPQPVPTQAPPRPQTSTPPRQQHGRRHGGDQRKGNAPQQPRFEPAAALPPQEVTLEQPMTVSELSDLLNVRQSEIIKQLFLKGKAVTVNQVLDVPTCEQVANLFNIPYIKPDLKKAGDDEATHDVLAAPGQRDKVDLSGCTNLQSRPPVVSIMGHVDHGKTTLLDAIRETRHKVVDTEAGGITQRIGAYTVQKDDQTVVFLDTPGHEAFTAMRMRGAKATDIAILVVAADDGVMPQTLEALQHARAAQIPIIVAVNKIDKAGADPDRVLSQLSDHGLVSEKWGGDTITVEVSALQKLGIDDLLDMILLVSELLELKADPSVDAQGVIVEAKLDKGKGPVATALVQNGTLSMGDHILCGKVTGRVRALINDDGERVKSAGPSQPVEILGLSEVPQAGEVFRTFPNEKLLKQYQQTLKVEEEEAQASRRSFLSAVTAKGSDAAADVFNIVVKGDSQGTVEAVTNALNGLQVETLTAQVIYTGAGDISETDLMLASASQAVVVGFNVREDARLTKTPLLESVSIHKFDVIYHLVERIQQLMTSRLKPEFAEVKAGVAEIREIFTINNQQVAGCRVLEGKVLRNARVSVIRKGQEVYNGSFNSLRHFKENVKEVRAGQECGMTFVKFDEFQKDDLVEVFVMEQVARPALV